MGFWNVLLKMGGSTLRGVGSATKATTQSVGGAILHPTQTLRTAGSAVKTATIGAGVGYVGWEKLTTDKSVVRIVSDAVIGENATDSLTETIGDVKDLKTKAGEAVDTVNSAVGSLGQQMNGISTFMNQMTSGNGGNMMSSFLGNLSNGKISGMSIVGLIAAAFLIFGRFGWMGKIAGAMLGMMMIGNNLGVLQPQSPNQSQAAAQEPKQSQTEAEHRPTIRR